jgi:hypothetical protein
LYDVGLRFHAAWQPEITSPAAPLNLGGSLTLAGSRFRGVSEASGGNTSQDSPSDRPVVQLRSLDSGLTLFLSSTNWSANSFTSLPVTNFPTGYALATLFVNGIPGTAAILLVAHVPTTILLRDATRLPGGSFQFGFTNTPGAVFTALATTNLSLPLNNWIALGAVTEISSGQFQFIDVQGTNQPKRFYGIRWP